MLSLPEVARVLSGSAFLFYGVICLASGKMVLEFDRYRLARFRPLVGVLEVVGALGLLAGFALPPLVAPAAGGLCLLMLLGILVRLRIRDPVAKMLPAFIFLLLNGFIFTHALSRS